MKGVRFLPETGIFFFATASRPAVVPTQLSIQRLPVVLSPGVKRSGRETDHSPQSSAEGENTWSYTSIPPSISLPGVVLNWAHGQLYFYTHVHAFLSLRIFIIWLSIGTGQLVDFCEHGNKLTGHIKGKELSSLTERLLALQNGLSYM
jgi:hypothetical protein